MTPAAGSSSWTEDEKHIYISALILKRKTDEWKSYCSECCNGDRGCSGVRKRGPPLQQPGLAGSQSQDRLHTPVLGTEENQTLSFTRIQQREKQHGGVSSASFLPSADAQGSPVSRQKPELVRTKISPGSQDTHGWWQWPAHGHSHARAGQVLPAFILAVVCSFFFFFARSNSLSATETPWWILNARIRFPKRK